VKKPPVTPSFVLLSDPHAALSTVELVRAAMKQGIDEAKRRGVPLFIPGDLNDTKAIIRGEVAIMLIEMMKYAREQEVAVYILIGNHDKLHEKGDPHSLEFLRPYAEIIDEPIRLIENIYAIPYQSSLEKLRAILEEIPKGSIILMHQGVKGAFMGEYVVDKTSIDPGELAGYAVVSGHYHRAQTIVTDGKKHETSWGVGTFNYVGTPYTVSFAEALDGPKGLQVMFTDGSLEKIPTNLRKHVIVECDVESVMTQPDGLKPEDKLWLKVSGPYSELEKLKKRDIGAALLGHSDFKFDKIPTDEAQLKLNAEELSDEQILDKMIDDSEETPEQKAALKVLWREVMSQ
jgi:DNA repair exonuclease SbcCD nuclease subunit